MSHRSTLAALLALVLTLPASAQWPTTDWVIREPPNGALSNVPLIGGELDNFVFQTVPPLGERGVFAAKHEGILEGASTWFQSLGFAPPLQLTTDGFDLEVGAGDGYLAVLKPDESEVGSSHKTSGLMWLTTHPGFLAVDTPTWTLMEASAVHEVYHAVQKGSNASLVQRMNGNPPQVEGCLGDSDLDWFVEGTAAMVQIRWLEGQLGDWGHPFLGSSRAAWVREFDQPLVRGLLPYEHQESSVEPTMTAMETVSWACDYGTWYLWYAIGDLIGRTPEEAVTYTRFILEGTEPWDDGGVANVDAGLKAAAAAYDAIGPFRGGLYDLYPEVVAQYLTADRFYGDLEEVELEAPGLYQADSQGDPLGPLATRAWRVRVRLPQNASPIPYNVRFTLEAEGTTDRDALHLIVDDDVAGRPAEDATPYTAVERTDLAEPAADGTVEYLVRVANVAEAATDTEPAEFSLRVEVDGFYGSDVDDSPTPGEVGGELPPGFAVNGLGPWACRGGSESRAVFDLVTPDEMGNDIDRAIPEMAQDAEEMLDDLEILMQRMERQGREGGMSREQIDEIRAQARAAIAQGRAEGQPSIDRAAAEARSRNVTELMATFVGAAAGDECQVTLHATLRGRQGGAQMIAGAVDRDRYPEDEAPSFDVGAFPAEVLEVMRSGLRGAMDFGPGQIPQSMAGMAELEDAYDGWQVCTMTDEERRRAREAAAGSDCPAVTCTAGQLVLERAEQGHIAGTFQFEVLQWPEESTGRCHRPSGRHTVTGHFNVASTDDGTDDNSLSGFGLGTVLSGASPMMPGMPILDFSDLNE